MKSCGWSFIYLLRPILLFSFLAYIATNVIIFYALPWGNQSLRQMIFEIVKSRANIDIKPNVFNRDFDNMVLMVKEKSGENSFKGVFIADSSHKGSTKIILSKKGFVMTDPTQYRIQLQLRNGTIHDLAKQGEDYQVMKFDRYNITLNIPGTDQMKKKRILKPREMSVPELKQRIKENEKSKWQGAVEKVELSKRFSIPLTCILFGIIGAPLGITSRRSGKSGGFVFAILIILIYYVSLVLLQNLGRTETINPYFSAWIPNIVLLMVTVYISYKTQKEIPFRTINKISDYLNSFQEYLLRKLGSSHAKTISNHHSKNQDRGLK